MIKITGNWHGEVAEGVFDAAWEGVVRAVVFYWTQLQLALNVPNTGVRVKRTRGKGSYTIYPNPSKPGEPPHKITGWLQRHVQYELNKGIFAARVGLQANAKYGVYLEIGTKFMAARPWLLATLKKVWSQMQVLARSGGTP